MSFRLSIRRSCFRRASHCNNEPPAQARAAVATSTANKVCSHMIVPRYLPGANASGRIALTQNYTPIVGLVQVRTSFLIIPTSGETFPQVARGAQLVRRCLGERRYLEPGKTRLLNQARRRGGEPTGSVTCERNGCIP